MRRSKSCIIRKRRLIKKLLLIGKTCKFIQDLVGHTKQKHGEERAKLANLRLKGSCKLLEIGLKLQS